MPLFATFDGLNIGLKLPEGYGFRAGREDGYNYFVLGTHYPEVSGLSNGRTGVSELIVRMLPQIPKGVPNKRKRVGLFNLSAWGLLPAFKQLPMNGSYVYDNPVPMTPIALLTHTHGKGRDFEFWRQTPDGTDELMWKQDPHNATYFLVPDHPLNTINEGDKLTVRCVFDNTDSSVLLVIE
jgi:hypothetical protein